MVSWANDMLKIDSNSLIDAMLEISVEIAEKIEKRANYLLIVDSFAFDGIVSRYPIQFTGNLGNSSSIEKTTYGAEITWSAPYASFVEFGTGSLGSEPIEFVSYDVIYDWVTSKQSKKLPLEGNEAVDFAKFVVTKINTIGQDPRPFVRAAIDYVSTE